jgi:hypothetical protein
MKGKQAIWESDCSSVAAVTVAAVAPRESDDFQRRGALGAASGGGLKSVC